MTAYASPGIYLERQKTRTSALGLRNDGLVGFVGIAQRGPLNAAVRIKSWEAFQENFGELIPQAYLPRAVKGYFENGGRECLVVRTAHLADPPAGGGAAKAFLGLKSRDQSLLLRCEAVDEGAWGNDVHINVIPLAEPEGCFHLSVKYKRQQEQFLNLSSDPGAANAAGLKVNAKSRWIRIDCQAPAGARQPLAALDHQCLQHGRDGMAGMEPADLIGRLDPRGRGTGLQCLEPLEEAALVALPDAVNPALFAASHYHAQTAMIQKNIIAFCEKKPQRFCLLDSPWGLDPQGIAQWRAGLDSACGALYYPWICVWDEKGGQTCLQPASGHVAGIITRLDRETQMLKHPANEPIQGALGTSRAVDEASQEYLHTRGINALRVLKARGTRVWGARTLSSNPEWRYINTRRLVSCIEQALREDLSWAVFENHEPGLWKSIARDVSCFLRDLWKKGYLAGAAAEEAFYVKCDEELNPESARTAGILTAEIGLAVAKPAEFIVVRISEKNTE